MNAFSPQKCILYHKFMFRSIKSNGMRVAGYGVYAPNNEHIQCHCILIRLSRLRRQYVLVE